MNTATSVELMLAQDRRLIEAELEASLPAATCRPPRLHEAMRYALLAGGKRLRPLLVLHACRASGGQDAHALAAAVAVEMIHTYSLVHDDLPAMDDDSLRRGRPTTHVVYGEAMAILVGDALLTRSFELLAGMSGPAGVQVAATLAAAAGAGGMIGGQVLDLEAQGRELHREALEDLHSRKTGALITAAAVSGGLCAGTGEGRLASLRCYGQAIGLAFQIIDDILDVTGTDRTLGKSAGKDARDGKCTFVSLLGLDPSRREATRLAQQAIDALAGFGDAADPLRHLARQVVGRSH